MAEIYRYCAILIVVHRVLCIVESNPLLEPQKTRTRYYEIDVENLRGLWHNAMIRGLIKARANELLPQIDHIEAIVYKNCLGEAKSTVALAKCAVRVFDARDNSKKIIEKSTKRDKKMKDKAVELPLWDNRRQRGFAEQPHTKFTYSTPFYTANSMISQQTLRTPYSRENDSAAAKSVRMLYSGRDMYPFMKQKLRTKPTKQKEYLRRKRKIGTDISDIKPTINLQAVAAKYFRKLLGDSTGSSNLENLRLIHDHFQRTEKINTYFKLMNDENRRLYEQIALPIDSRTPQITNNAQSAIEQVLEVVNGFVASNLTTEKLSVLSPRLLSLFPDSSHSSAKRLLSPTFLSFQKDGFLSLPEVFDILTTDQKYQQMMLDVVLDVSGAGPVLQKVVDDMKLEMDDLKNVKLPLVEQLSQKDANWILECEFDLNSLLPSVIDDCLDVVRAAEASTEFSLPSSAHDSLDEDQARDYTEKGYAFMDENQLNLIYTEQEQLLSGINVTKLGKMSNEEKAARLEHDIREMAALDRPKWPLWESDRPIKKRHVSEAEHAHNNASISNHHNTSHEGGHHEEERVNGVLYETLRPFAFNSIVSRGGALEVVTLSPHAFISEIAHPEALKLETLSPRAFVATILSPAALIARILSPTALRAEVLSPRALHAWVLSPEALVAEVLTPRFFDPRVLSPEALVIDVLSPGFLSPHFLSSETIGLIILSPNILSPRIAGAEKLLVEVLSPHILGGPHTHEEASNEVVEVGSHSPKKIGAEVKHKERKEHKENQIVHRNLLVNERIRPAIVPSPFKHK